MYTDYVMIDYENVQRPNLSQFQSAENAVKVMLFVGAAESQKTIPTDLAMELHKLGEHAEFVKIDRIESQALDFHIAYYIGRLSVEQPTARFHIVSSDNGYDALTDHLLAKYEVKVIQHCQETQRSTTTKGAKPATTQPATAVPKTTATATPQKAKTLDERARYVFSKIKNAKPGTPEALKKHIGSLSQHLSKEFGITVNGRETDEIILAMKNVGLVRFENGRLTYKS